MLAGCSSVRSASEASVLLRAFHIQPQEKMSTHQHFDLPRTFSMKDALSSEKPAGARGSCSFRQNPITPSSSSLVAQAAPWGLKREIVDTGLWEQKRSLKRFYERSSSEDSSAADRVKRIRTGSTPTTTQLVGGGEEFWSPHSIEDPTFGEEEVCFVTAKDYSSSSSGAPNEDFSENETWNGSHIPCSSEAVRVGGQDDCDQTARTGLELVRLITLCAESISSGNHTAINFLIARLGELASPVGSPIHRIVAYFTEALALRAVKLWPHIFSIAPPREIANPIDDDDATALRILNHVSPIPKFLHFTLNERLLRAFEGKDRVHIIDFDIKQGLQWPSLLQSLASQPNPPTHVRITGIGESKHDLQDTGARLAGLAEALNLPFEFHAVVDRLEDVRLWMLHVKEKEFVAVNCILQLHKSLYNENRMALMDLLGLIRSTNPLILLMAEEEAEHNEPRWEKRFANCLKYYSVIFDSLASSLPENSPARIKVEEMFARKIRNIIACEGVERFERHEKFDKWIELMEDGGFSCVGIGERETLQSRLLLRMYPSSENYSIEKKGEGLGLTLRWLDQPLYTVSAWAPIGNAGNSSTSQPG